MPRWGEILGELAQSALTNNGQPDFDSVRRKYVAELATYTGRNTVVYASDWMSPAGSAAPGVSIILQDMQGLMEVFKDLPGPELDLVIHSPGGDPNAASSLVEYMRQKYDDVRVFVPLAAMSAATMWCLASDQIVMGKHSQLGPIDPQLQMAQGMVPAAAIRRQFETAKEECAADPRKLSGWMPTLQQYFPGMVEICADAEQLGRSMVTEWLQKYMFRDDDDSAEKAERVAAFVSDDREHGSHGRGIHRDRLRGLGVNISDLEDDPALQDAVLSVHHATMHTLTGTATMKIVENHLGRSFVNMVQQIQMPTTMMPVAGP